jgi:hypothetical protein
MKLSNFDWTDKDSVKWFILLPTGHEGPYSLNQLFQMVGQKKLSPSVKVWAEGLTGGISLNEISAQVESAPAIPDLPPLPEDDIPPLPIEDAPPKVPPPSPNVPEVKKSSTRSIVPSLL